MHFPANPVAACGFANKMGFCFGSLVVLGVARCCLWLFALYVDVGVGGGGC